MGIPNFSEWRERCAEMRAEKDAAFPVHSVVAVASERYHGIGIVSFDESCPLEKLAVRVESLNVWWYPIEDCKPYGGKMPTWMRGFFRSHKTKRNRLAPRMASILQKHSTIGDQK